MDFVLNFNGLKQNFYKKFFKKFVKFSLENPNLTQI